MQRFADDDTRIAGNSSGPEVQEAVGQNSKQMRILCRVEKRADLSRGKRSRTNVNLVAGRLNFLIARDALLANGV